MSQWTDRVYKPCIHRGQLLELVQVCLCTGRKNVGIYPCAIKGQCTVSVRHKGLQTCISCPSFKLPEQAPPPAKGP